MAQASKKVVFEEHASMMVTFMVKVFKQVATFASGTFTIEESSIDFGSQDCEAC